MKVWAKVKESEIEWGNGHHWTHSHAFCEPGMYVIYPAEEIISLTYGVAAAVQRPTIQRPTLDNLREPLVPVGTRTPSPASVPSSSSASKKSAKVPKSANTNHALNNNPNVFITDPTTFDTTSDFDETITLNNFNGNPIAYYTPPSSPSLDPTSAITTPGKPPQPPPPKQGKPKSKLQLKFAKLGRPHSSPEPAESTRVLEYHDIRVSNPTFTRDNLRARNFDAFFEAGESVYSIETKEKTSSPSTEPSPTIDDTFYVPQPPPKPPKSKLNFLKRNKSPQPPKQQPVPPQTPSSRRGSRSSDIFLIVEEPQKGDRCTPLMILIALVL